MICGRCLIGNNLILYLHNLLIFGASTTEYREVFVFKENFMAKCEHDIGCTYTCYYEAIFETEESVWKTIKSRLEYNYENGILNFKKRNYFDDIEELSIVALSREPTLSRKRKSTLRRTISRANSFTCALLAIHILRGATAR